MAITHVQKIGSVAGNSAASIAVTPASGHNTVSGNTLIVGVVWYRSSGTWPACTITDSNAGNTYTTLYSFTTGSASIGPNLLIAACFNAASVTHAQSITATFSGGSGAPFSIILADEFNGVTSSQDGSTVSANTISSNSVAFGTLNTNNPVDLVMAYIASFGNLTATAWSGAWSANKEFQSAGPTLSMSYQLPTSTGAFSGTATISASEVSDYALLALKGASTFIPLTRSLRPAIFKPG